MWWVQGHPEERENVTVWRLLHMDRLKSVSNAAMEFGQWSLSSPESHQLTDAVNPHILQLLILKLDCGQVHHHRPRESKR